MILSSIGISLLLLSLFLFRMSEKFTIDASPVGSIMILIGILLILISLFVFGIEVGIIYATANY